MRLDLRFERRAQGREQLAESVATATLQALEAPVSAPDGLTIVAMPPARANPYQQLLYRNAHAHGIGLAYALDLDEVDGLRWPYPTALHVHWTRQITKDAVDVETAHEAVDAAITMLDSALQRGVGLVWTVHNVLPHECVHPAADVRLRGWMADHADMVHVMGRDTPDAVADHYVLPSDERLVTIPHPSYIGVYPDHITRAEARLELGLSAHQRVGILFGSIRGYKGIDLLAEAVAHLPDDVVVLVVGAAIDNDAREAVRDLVDQVPQLRSADRRVAVEDVQLFHRAADFAVLPYADGLNSGACLLAVTFGLTVVAPAIGTFPETLEGGLGELYEPGDASALATAIERAAVHRGERADVIAYAQAHRADVISERFFLAIRERLGNR